MILSTIGSSKQRRLLTLFLDDIPATKIILFWGRKHPNRRELAKISSLSFLSLGDGFLRSPGLGVAGCPPYSIVYDDIGIYYDTTRPSHLEQLILAADAIPSETLEQAQQTIDLILRHRLSEYSHAPELSDGHPLRAPSESETVLTIDQMLGDMAIRYDGADAATFERIFQTTLDENP